MANMDYCKFENTVRAMEQCLNNMPNSTDELNEYESLAYKQFLELIAEHAEEAQELLEEIS